MRLLVPVLVLATSAPAFAGDEPEFVTSTDQHTDVYAAGTAGTALQELSVGAAIDGEAVARHWDSSSYIRGGASALLRGGSDGAGVSVREETRARAAFYLFEPTVAQRLGFDLAPSLADRPERWRRRYSFAGFDANVIALNLWNRHWGVQLIRVDNGFDWETQHDGSATAHRHVETADWAPLSITRRAGGEEVARLDPVAFEARAIAGSYSGVVLTTFAPRITGIPVGFGARLDVAVGTASTGWSSTSINGNPPEIITSEQLPDKHVPATRVKLMVPIGGLRVTTLGERGMYLGPDATLVVEERATVAAETTIEGASVRAAGFAAHSVIWTSPTDSSEHVTGGGSLAVDVPLEDHWKLTNQAELARTFYASLDGDRTPRVDTALRVDVGLHHAIANWIPR